MGWISRSSAHWSVSQPPGVEMCFNPSVTPQRELWPWLCKAVVSSLKLQWKNGKGNLLQSRMQFAAAERKISMGTTTVVVSPELDGVFVEKSGKKKRFLIATPCNTTGHTAVPWDAVFCIDWSNWSVWLASVLPTDSSAVYLPCPFKKCFLWALFARLPAGFWGQKLKINPMFCRSLASKALS